MTYYQFLNVKETASTQEILDACDRVEELIHAMQQDETAKMAIQTLNEAKATLLNTGKRRLYNEKLADVDLNQRKEILQKETNLMGAVYFFAQDLKAAHFSDLKPTVYQYFSNQRGSFNSRELYKAWKDIYEFCKFNEETVYHEGKGLLHKIMKESFEKSLDELIDLSIGVINRVCRDETFSLQDIITLTPVESEKLQTIVHQFMTIEKNRNLTPLFAEINDIVTRHHKQKPDESWKEFAYFLATLDGIETGEKLTTSDVESINHIQQKLKSLTFEEAKEITNYLYFLKCNFWEKVSLENKTIYLLFDRDNDHEDAIEIQIAKNAFNNLHPKLKQVIAANITAAKNLLKEKVSLTDFQSLTVEELQKLFTLPASNVADLYFAGLPFKKLLDLDQASQQNLLTYSSYLHSVKENWHISIDKLIALSNEERLAVFDAYQKSAYAVKAVMEMPEEINSPSSPRDQFIYRFQSLQKHFMHFKNANPGVDHLPHAEQSPRLKK